MERIAAHYLVLGFPNFTKIYMGALEGSPMIGPEGNPSYRPPGVVNHGPRNIDDDVRAGASGPSDKVNATDNSESDIEARPYRSCPETDTCHATSFTE